MNDALTTWLREQIETGRRTASPKILERHGRWRADGAPWDNGAGVLGEDGLCVAVATGSYAAEHIALNDPPHILARCEAELAILGEHYILTSTDRNPDFEEFGVYRFPSHPFDFGCVTCHYYAQGAVRNYGWCRTLKHLASGYRHRPGYLEEWALPEPP